MKKNNQRKSLQKVLGVLLALVLTYGAMIPQVGAVYAENIETIADTAESAQGSQNEETQTDSYEETQMTYESDEEAQTESSETKSTETKADETGLPEGWSPGSGSRSNGTGGQDVTSYLIWDNAVLKVLDRDTGKWTEITNPNNYVYPSYDHQYAFSIDWKIATSAINDLDGGDWFTFTVPTPFAPGTIDMIAPDGVTILGTIRIDTDGNAKAVFNSNVEKLEQMWGSITISGTYSEETAGEKVDWTFDFGDVEIDYTGKAQGYDGDSAIGNANLYKYGYSDDAGKATWVIRLNQAQQAGWGGSAAVNVTDTFGAGYVLDVANNHDTSACSEGDCIDHSWGQYAADTTGYEDHAYFEFIVINWNAIRADYKAANPSSTIGANEINEAMVDMKWDEDNKGKLKYLSFLKASEIKSIEVTADGFEIIFADGVLDGRCIEIYCWVKVTSLKDEVIVENTASANGHTDSDSTGVAGGAIAEGITGKEGELLLYKQNADETETLPGATFELTRDGGVVYNPITTDAGGKLTFKLNASYEGTYTLTETAAPDGYVSGEPITLKLNIKGYITEVNGQTISANETGTVIYDTKGNEIGWISGNRLWLIIQNEKATTGSFTVTKKDATTGSILPGAEFNLYYLDGGTKQYYTTSGTWDTNVSNAKPLTTDESGKISVTDLPYNTYYLVETKAPDGYILDSTPIEIKVTDSVTTVEKEISNTPIKPIEVILKGTKTLTGKTLADDMFEFIVENAAKTTVATGKNKADGSIEFTPINYTYSDIGQTYTYTVKEVTGTDSSIIYDETSYTVTVTISLDSNGVLQANIVYPTGGIIFNNISKGSMNFQKVDAKDTTKTLEGAVFSLYKCDDTTHNTASDHDGLEDAGTCWQLVEVDVDSDPDGYFGFDDLLSGTYLLVETTVPNGYQLPEGQWIITFDMTDGIQSIAVLGSTSGTLAMKQADPGSSADYLVLNLNVENYEMPMAGSTGVYGLIAGGCLLIACSLMGAGMLWKRKRKPSGS